MDYAIYLATLTVFFASLAVSLRVLVGVCGIVSVSHAAFFGIGAYGGVLLNKWIALPPLLAPFVLAVAGALIGQAMARATVRIRDDYLVIFTLAAQLIFSNVVRNGGEITGGPAGLTVARPFAEFGREAANLAILAFGVVLLAIAIAVSLRLDRSPFGQALRAMRDDEVFARSVGRATAQLKSAAFAISAAMATGIGALYPYFTGFIDPSQFTISQSIAILSMVIIGGGSRISGALVGAALLVLLPEALRNVGFAGSIGNLQQIALGGLLVLFVALRPGGIVGGENVFSRLRS